MLVVFRIGSNIPVPGINRDILDQAFNGDSGLFELFDLFSGGAFSNLTIFALSITPYITASIVLQLLTIAIPALERLAKEGVEGRKKIARYTRYLTVALAFVQAIGMTLGIFKQYLLNTDFFHITVVVFVLSAGTAFLMWLGELINEKGIGNGISLIIFGGIVARVPSAVMAAYSNYKSGAISLVGIFLFLAFAILVIIVIIEIQQGHEKNTGTVCQESSRKKDVWRPVYTYSSKGKSGGSYSSHLCSVHPAVPARQSHTSSPIQVSPTLSQSGCPLPEIQEYGYMRYSTYC